MDVVWVANQPKKSLKQQAEEACFEQGIADEAQKASFLAGVQFRAKYEDDKATTTGFFMGLVVGGLVIFLIGWIFR